MNNFLDSLNAPLREAMQKIAVSLEFTAGQTIFSRGELGDALYVIETGTVRVHDGDLVLNRLERGDVFGEIAGLGETERTASVTAEQDLSVLRVGREDLYEAVLGQPEALKGLIRMLCERESGIANRMTDRSLKLQAAEQELNIGRKIQAGFLPNALPEVDGYEIACHFQAAREVAGDFYDTFYIPAIDRLALVIGDVCDKGVGAALFMTLFRSLIRATAQSRTFMTWATQQNPADTDLHDRHSQPELARETLANTIALTNNYVATTHGQTSMFASVFLGLLDTGTGQLDYINAGHEDSFILGPQGVRAVLTATGPVVGIFAGAAYDIATTHLDPGEMLLLYSDGIPEAMNESGEQFSDQRLRDLLDAWKGDAQGLMDNIVGAVENFSGSARQHDDITLLVSGRKSV